MGFYERESELLKKLTKPKFPPNKQEPLTDHINQQINTLLGAYTVDGKLTDCLTAIARSNLDVNLIFNWLIESNIKQAVLHDLLGSYYEWNLNAFIDAVNIKMIQYPIGDYGYYAKTIPETVIKEMKDMSPYMVRIWLEEGSKLMPIRPSQMSN